MHGGDPGPMALTLVFRVRADLFSRLTEPFSWEHVQIRGVEVGDEAVDLLLIGTLRKVCACM